MTKILVLYYSSWGHMEAMAQAAAEGAKSAGADVTLKRVPELVPESVAKQFHYKLDQKAPIADPHEVADYDGIIFATPTRYGMMASQMKNFLDQTGGVWTKGGLVGKPAAVMVGTGNQHGGQESAILSFHTALMHHGMIIVGLPYTYKGQMGHDIIRGGSPYGASTTTGGDGSRMPSTQELEAAHWQGAYLTQIAAKLAVK